MMVEFKWISLFLPAVLQFTAAAGKLPLYFTVRVGDDVTLPCENVIDGQQECEYTRWIFIDSGNTTTVRLAKLGQIIENAKSKSDRLSVTENCSLVIKKVTVEDVGLYICRQFRSGQQQGEGSAVHLSVINMTEHQDADKVTLNCSVLTDEQCRHTVKWLYEGNKNDLTDMKRSQHSCSATVTFTTPHFNQKSKHPDLFKCNVTDGYTKKVQLFPFSPQSSGEKPGEDATTTAISPKTIKSPSTTRNKWTSMKITTSAGTNNTVSTNDNNGAKQEGLFPGCLWFIFVSLGLAALIIIVVVAIRWKRNKGNKTQMYGSMADPEDGVSYASISYTRKTNSKGRVRIDVEDDAVTYSTVKASSSSAGSSAGPSNLYAPINK